MNEEWGTPISKDKIIYRRNKLVELAKVEAKPYTIWHETINENLLDINYMIYEIERLKEELEYTIPIVEHNKTITKHLKEIERLKELCDKYEEEHNTTFETWQKDIKENKKLHSIIKEVREYMKNTMEVDKEYPDYMTLEICEYQELLDILDKVGDEK